MTTNAAKKSIEQAEPANDSPKLTKKDFASDQMVRWCPGCGDYAILTAVQNTLADLGVKREETVFISGIGCSSRFPYYLNTFGFHTIHGRAMAIATGTKVANPKLNVWVVSGDGDSLAIGGNHFIHSIRRNIDINYLIFNNEIYGLTKGQYSPTSRQGKVTKSSPYGTFERTFCAGSLALGAKASFYARLADTSPRELKEILKAAAEHKGTSVVEILQNCVIFNDKTHTYITDRAVRAERQLLLKHGEPMIFGNDNDKGIMMERATPKVVQIGKNGVTRDDILVHDAHNPSEAVAFMLTRMSPPEFPMPMGIFRDVYEPTYDEQLYQQIDEVTAKKPGASLKNLLYTSATWKIE